MKHYIVVRILDNGVRICKEKETGKEVVFDKETLINEKVGEEFELDEGDK